jgi:hypothetical protein
MTKPDLTFHEATAEYAAAYYGGQPPFTFRGYVAVLDDKPVGVGGIFWHGHTPIAFSEMKEEMQPRTKDKARAARKLEGFINAYKVPVYAIATEPTSVPLLTKFGFALTGQIAPQGPVMRRDPDNVD